MALCSPFLPDSQPSMDKVFAEKLKKLLEEDDQASDSQTESLIQLREKVYFLDCLINRLFRV